MISIIIKGYGQRIIALYFTEDTFLLKLYDLDLKLLKLKYINLRINLHSINSNEIICFSTNKSRDVRYLVLDYELNIKFSFGQSMIIFL